MKRLAVLVAPLLISACTYGPGGPPSLEPLAQNQGQPGPALIEHLLTAYLATLSADGDSPTVCASMKPQALSDPQEKSLLARFPRLAPLGRCKASGIGYVDAISGEPAQVVEVYDFSCDTPTACLGWANVPGRPSTRWQMRWLDECWHFAEDLRLVEQR